MLDAPTNLRVLRRSRPKLQAGDVFAMLPPDDQYLFGRVINTDVLGPMHGILIYVYRVRSPDKEPPSEMNPRGLLIPPVITNRLGWVHGRFENIAHRALTESDVLRQHCFYADGAYHDEHHNRLAERIEPCGVGGLASYRMLDDLISDALGIERIPGE